MATKNRKWFNEFSVKYGITVQPVKFNEETIHVAKIGNEHHTALAQLTKAQTEALFKRIHDGECEVMDNKTCVTQTGRVSINGTRHDILDTIKGIKVNRLLDILDKSVKNISYYNFCNWLMVDENRREYLRTVEGINRWQGYLQLEYYFQTGEIKSNTKDLMQAWEELADRLAEEEGVELVEA